jgi:hypothetical protein
MRMFQLVVGRLLIPTIIVLAFLSYIFWFRKKQEKANRCSTKCEGKCSGKTSPEGESEK